MHIGMSLSPNEQGIEDSVFLERLLDGLYDFGHKQSRKKRAKKRKTSEEETKDQLPATPNAVPIEPDRLCPDERRQRLQTEASKSKQESSVEVVTFQDPTKKPKVSAGHTQIKRVTDVPEKKDELAAEELSLEKARLEVHRFGITGYKKEQQRVFEQDRAVMLGARPPKKEYVNYKTLQQQISDKKKKKEEVQPDKRKKRKQQSDRDQKTKKKASAAPGSGSGSGTGQVGRFKNGVLVLSPKEIQKIKARR